MNSDIVDCPVTKTKVRKSTRCPDHTCENCPERLARERIKEDQGLSVPTRAAKSSTQETHPKAGIPPKMSEHGAVRIYIDSESELEDLLPRRVCYGRDDMARLYSWNGENIAAEQEKRGGMKEPISDDDPFVDWFGAIRLIESYKKYHQDGGTKDVLETIFTCFVFNFPIPRWCVDAFAKAYAPAGMNEAKSWDDAFGRLHKKGTHVDAKRQKEKAGFAVYQEINRIRTEDPSRAIGDGLFVEVGQKFGVRKTLAEEYYYYWKSRREEVDSRLNQER